MYSMKKLLPQFQYVKLWQVLLLSIFSVFLTWVAIIYAVIQYVHKTGNEISEFGGLSQVALTSFDATVLIFGLGVFCIAGLGCFILLSIFKPLRVLPLVQVVWALLIVLGVALAKVFS